MGTWVPDGVINKSVRFILATGSEAIRAAPHRLSVSTSAIDAGGRRPSMAVFIRHLARFACWLVVSLQYNMSRGKGAGLLVSEKAKMFQRCLTRLMLPPLQLFAFAGSAAVRAGIFVG